MRPTVVLRPDFGMGNGTEVDLQLKAGALVIRRARQQRYRLSELLTQVQKSNQHAETDWGGPAGKEIW